MQFTYKALGPDGNVLETTVEAKNRYELMNSLREQGMTILDLQEETPSAVTEQKPWKLEFFGISRTTVAFFTRQFAELTDAGFSLVESLNAMQRFSPNARMCEVIRGVATEIQKGKGLSAAMSGFPEAFNGLYLSLIKVGEKTGNLPAMLGRLADYQERDLSIQSKVRSALAYPSFIMMFSLVLVYAMVAFLLPTFEPMWKSAGMNLSHYPITLALMNLSALTHSFWDEVLVFSLLTGLAYGLKVYTRTPEGGRNLDWFFVKLPLLGNFLILSVMARVAATLATLLDSGASFLQALELAAGVAGNRLVADALNQISRDVAGGSKLGASFEKHLHIFPPLLVQMVAMGEESGHLNQMLGRIARYYDSQLDAAVKAFSSLVEPLLMLVVGGVVFTFVLGVMLPIMGIVAALQAQM